MEFHLEYKPATCCRMDDQSNEETGDLSVLPDDIKQIILSRLPAHPNSLARAISVCKKWKRLIASNSFRRLLIDNQKSPPFLGLFTRIDGMFRFLAVGQHPDMVRAEVFEQHLQSETDDPFLNNM